MKIGSAPGAIGCYSAVKLIAAGHEVVLVGRLGDEIRANGLELTDYAGGRVKVAASAGALRRASPRRSPTSTWSSCTVKSQATEDAARPLARRSSRGLRRSSAFRTAYRTRAAARGAASAPDPRGDGALQRRPHGAGELSQRDERAARDREKGDVERPIADALRSAGFEVELHAALQALQWSKLLINLNNAVNALGGVPLYEQIRDRTYRRVMASGVREGIAAMRANGLRIARVGRMLPTLAPIVLSLPDVVSCGSPR